MLVNCKYCRARRFLYDTDTADADSECLSARYITLPDGDLLGTNVRQQLLKGQWSKVVLETFTAGFSPDLHACLRPCCLRSSALIDK